MTEPFGFKMDEDNLGVEIAHFFSGDERGSFSKIFEKDIYEDNNIVFPINEVFFSTSKKNVIRGIHFQLYAPQAKIISVIAGRAWDVIVDLRVNSKTFKKWQGFWLDEKDNKAIYIPPGFGHGFLSETDNMKMIYLCCGKYDKKSDSGIRFDDPDIGIRWPIKDLKDAIHAERDMKLMGLREYLNDPMKI